MAENRAQIHFKVKISIDNDGPEVAAGKRWGSQMNTFRID